MQRYHENTEYTENAKFQINVHARMQFLPGLKRKIICSYIHQDKCRLMFISRNSTHFITPPPTLYINKVSQIQSTDSVKYLWILTPDLTWSTHLTAICAKTRKLAGLLHRRFHYRSPNVKLTFYKAFIRPHVEYPNYIVWYPHLLKHDDLLE